MQTQLVTIERSLLKDPWIPNMEIEPTARELECLRGVASGQTTTNIAHELNISPRTVDHHIANIMRKLGAPTRASAVAVAMDRGYVALADLK